MSATVSFKRILIANRGEIAIRIACAAADLGIETVCVGPKDDASSLHLRRSNLIAELPGAGPAAYLSVENIIDAAIANACDAIHPGYGFLSENAEFARACATAGLVFIGPSPDHLEAFGDKAKARERADSVGVPLLVGTGALDLEGAKSFFEQHGPMMLKAIAGGGGRGMRPVDDAAQLEAAFEACGREAQSAFGNNGVYAEQFVRHARHIEVQIVGDGTQVLAVGDRDCSVQRRNQKIIEIAPAPALSDALRSQLHQAAEAICAGYRTLATVEFLVDVDTGRFAFIETNARLQVEHTITEEVTGLDLVAIQIQLAAGATLASAGLQTVPQSTGYAVQSRVNLETLLPDGAVQPAGGLLSVYEPPSGPGIRVDGFGYGGYLTSPNYDSLLAKVIVRGKTLELACERSSRALAEFRIQGADTNIHLLRALLFSQAVQTGQATTRLLESELLPLLGQAEQLAQQSAHAVGAQVETHQTGTFEQIDGAQAVCAPLLATVGVIDLAVGDVVLKGQDVAVLEAMKMEHLVKAEFAGRVVKVVASRGDTLPKGAPLLFLEPVPESEDLAVDAASVDPDVIRPDLQQVIDRHRFTLDEARPEAVAKRRRTGHRTARENLDDLLDDGSFIEYGALAIAAQRRRRSVEDLIANTPADGIITGIGTVNAEQFGPEATRVAALSYDFTVLAGTQGHFNHKKTDRLLHLVSEQKLPLVWYAEGGGGRPGDTDTTGVAGLDVPTFRTMAELSGDMPKIAIVAGRCFAGNAAVAGLCEFLIATRDSNLGMGGPAMIEGGGLGVYKPEDIGPISVQESNGVVDLVADDEAHATAMAKQALSYFQGRKANWSCADQRLLRQAIPENRLRVYDIRAVISGLVDQDSFLELRQGWAAGMVTGLVRLAGRPMGLIANDPTHLGGAIDCDAAEKAARFLQMCDAFDLPVLSLCDTPGFMVGPESEQAGAVRRVSRMFVAGAKLGTPLFTVVLRKGYGLGAQAMAGGSFGSPFFITSWPTGEFGGMGLEGAVRLGYRKELEAETDPVKNKELYDKLVANMYARGKSANMAQALEIDSVIDPVETRRWVLAGLDSCAKRQGTWKKRVDTF